MSLDVMLKTKDCIKEVKMTVIKILFSVLLGGFVIPAWPYGGFCSRNPVYCGGPPRELGPKFRPERGPAFPRGNETGIKRTGISSASVGEGGIYYLHGRDGGWFPVWTEVIPQPTIRMEIMAWADDFIQIKETIIKEAEEVDTFSLAKTEGKCVLENTDELSVIAVSDDGEFALVELVEGGGYGTACDYEEYLVIPTKFLISEKDLLKSDYYDDDE